MTPAKRKKLGSVISVSKGKKHLVVEAPSSSSKRLLGIDDLRNDDLLRFTDDPSGTAVLPEDVLIAWDGANAGTIGFGKSGYIGSTIARLRIDKGEKIFTPFLGAFLKSKFDYLRQTATGATIPHINRKALDDIELPDVNFNDQIRIAHLLGKVEGLIVQRKQHLQQFDDLLKSVFLEMFGDPVRNEKGWETDSLANFGTFKNGLNFGKGESGVQVRCLGVGDFKSLSKITDVNCLSTVTLDSAPPDDYFLRNGDLVFVRSNGNRDLVGRCIAIYPNEEKVAFSGFCIRFRITKFTIEPTYITHLFRAASFRRSLLQGGQGANIQNISQKSLSELAIPTPPPELQRQFSTMVEKVEDIKSRYQQSFTDLETLYGALSQQAFKGELDLSRVPLPETKPEETNAVATEPLHAPTEQGLAIKLPDTGNLLDALESAEAREGLILQWLEAYCGQLDNMPFSVQHFMAAAQARLAELHPDNDFALSANDYEHIKAWVFDALSTGTLVQEFDDEHNLIQLKAAQP